MNTSTRFVPVPVPVHVAVDLEYVEVVVRASMGVGVHVVDDVMTDIGSRTALRIDLGTVHGGGEGQR